MKSPKIEGDLSSPIQVAAMVSAAKTLKFEMPDNLLLSDTKLGIKTPKSEIFDSKSGIKIPKTEAVELLGNTPLLIISSDSEGSIDNHSLSKRGKDFLTPLKRRFVATSCHPVKYEHGTSDEDEESSSTDNIEDQGSTDGDEEEESCSTDEDEEHGSTDENEDEEHGSTNEDEEHGSNDDDDSVKEKGRWSPEEVAVKVEVDAVYDEEWVTVFGFTYKDTKFVLQEFNKCGVILDYVCQGNWMHILYQNRREAQKALSKSGKKINKNLIVGLNPVVPNQKQALNDRKPSLSGVRVRKAFNEGICLLHRSEGNFFVLGATGNVYTVKLSTTPVCRCNCPDSVVPCKHILFVFLCVLGISQSDCRLCRKRLTPCQLTDLLKMPSSAQTLASAYTREKFRHLFTAAKVKVGLPPSIGNGVQCAICQAEMDRLHDDEVVKCGSCGDVGHKMCLVTYRKSRGEVVRKCKSCRTNWVAALQNWYTNLAR